MGERIIIDGSQGEGGGQILRTALALSCVTGRPFRIEGIRGGRAKPGLLRQHLTAVQAAAAISGAHVAGAGIGSGTLDFAPGPVRGGEYDLSIGTAGSATLVLQAVLPALLAARTSARLSIEGGTHNPQAPPFDFLQLALLPLLRRMGARIEATLERHGFYPAGGGRIVVSIEPCETWRPLTLLERNSAHVHARALVAALPARIGHRELAVVHRRLGLERERCRVETIDSTIGPGNVVLIEIDAGTHTEVVTGFGSKGVTSEEVAASACEEAERYLAAAVPVGVHLADQLLVPMAVAGGGAFETLPPTAHTETNAAIVRRFIDTAIAIDVRDGTTCRVTVGTAR